MGQIGSSLSVAWNGLSGEIVTVECDLARGLPGTIIVGTQDSSVMQARVRVKAGVVNSGLQWPHAKVIFSLTPADYPKNGCSFDLVLIASLLDAQGYVDHARNTMDETIVLGEVALDGSVRAVRNILPALIVAKNAGYRRVIIPAEQGWIIAQKAIDLEFVLVDSVQELVEYVRQGKAAQKIIASVDIHKRSVSARTYDMSEVIGQGDAKYGLMVAAVGKHNVHLSGPPGTGKTMLAERYVGILPPLSVDARSEVIALDSYAHPDTQLSEMNYSYKAPCVIIDQTISASGLLGGGSGHPKPGAVSRAHNGVLVLDEMIEVPRLILESLRTVLETKAVSIHRAQQAIVFPADFQLIAASNRCRCNADDPQDCRCSASEKRKYLTQLSEPISERIDIHIQTHRLNTREPIALTANSAQMAQAVSDARMRSMRRWEQAGLGKSTLNSEVPGHLLRSNFPPDSQGQLALNNALHSGEVSFRGADRVLQIAWSITDLRGLSQPDLEAVLDALTYFTTRL